MLKELEKERKFGIIISLLFVIITGASLIVHLVSVHNIKETSILETGTVTKIGETVTFTVNGETIERSVPKGTQIEEGKQYSLYVTPDMVYLVDEVNNIIVIMLLGIMLFISLLTLFTLIETGNWTKDRLDPF